MITLGTGIGTAIFHDGNLLPNTEFGHLEIKGEDAEFRASDAAREREDLSWGKYAKRLNTYLLAMEKLFWPDLFIIGGGISKKHEKIPSPAYPADGNRAGAAQEQRRDHRRGAFRTNIGQRAKRNQPGRF